MKTAKKLIKAIKRMIAYVCQKVFGRVRWLKFLLRVGNIDHNSFYDHLTKIIFDRVLTPNSFCIDIGCSKGDILSLMMEHSPNGQFLAFEPLPDHYEELAKKFQSQNVRLYNIALSDSTGTASFNYVISNPAYSGLKKRPYDRDQEDDCQIEVKTDRLDNILKSITFTSIDIIKIDVEGGEYLVLQGALDCIKKYKPFIVFEHGPGSAKAYGTKSEAIYDLLCTQCGLKISLLQDWLLEKPSLNQDMFCKHVYGKKNYYFIAHP